MFEEKHQNIWMGKDCIIYLCFKTYRKKKSVQSSLFTLSQTLSSMFVIENKVIVVLTKGNQKYIDRQGFCNIIGLFL